MRIARRCKQIHLTRDSSHAPSTRDHNHIVTQSISSSQSLHLHVIHAVTTLERALCVLVLSPLLFISHLPFLFHRLSELCRAHLPQCRHRQRLKPLHSRTMKSSAPWRYNPSEETAPLQRLVRTRQKQIKSRT